MKNLKINLTTLVAAFAMLALISFDASAQNFGRGNARANGQNNVQGPGMGYGRGDCTAIIPDLTEDQEANILKLRNEHFRNAEIKRAEIIEKQAKLNSLRVTKNQDAAAIDKNIDELASLRASLMKEREAHRREVKNLLTDDQKVWFDANTGQGRGRGFGAGNRGMRGNGQGMRGNGQGRGWRNCPYN
ncbi:MAG: periplasmic heavy metal sensor [Bacteroidales bacterium]|jgi:Spy/CpxP family protein refolding chaperone|nr:periplasmic heavy metal sensor [Bacteroidales bacterium]